MTVAPHLPPQDLESEEAVLGAMLKSGTAIEKVIESPLTEASFARPSHRIVFAAILAMHEQGAVDDVTVITHLKAEGKLAEAGGAAQLMSLSERCPTVANVRAYIDSVVEHATLRSIAERGLQIATMAYERAADTASLVIEAGRIVDELSDRAITNDAGITTLADELMPLYDEMQERSERGARITGLDTGFRALNDRLGGLQDGKLYVIAGRPGMGKSVLGSGLAENVVFGCGEDVYIANLEMGTREQTGRTIARAGSISLSRITNQIPDANDFQATYETIEQLTEMGKRLHLDQSADLTAQQISFRARKLNRKLKRDGRRLRMVVVDYLQLITPAQGIRADNENAAITHNSRMLKQLARSLNIPVVVLSQLNRAVEDRPDRKPRLSDLRGSGAIEQDADVIMLLFRPEYYAKDDTPVEWQGVVQVDTAKWRGGQIGVDKLAFDGAYVRFRDLPDTRKPGLSAAVLAS